VLLIPKRHRQTDRRTDGRLTVALPRSALASRGKNRRHWSGEMHLTPLPEVARPRRLVECVAN